MILSGHKQPLCWFHSSASGPVSCVHELQTTFVSADVSGCHRQTGIKVTHGLCQMTYSTSIPALCCFMIPSMKETACIWPTNSSGSTKACFWLLHVTQLLLFPLPSLGFWSILYYVSCKVKVKSLSHVWLFATPWTVAYQAPLSMGFSRQDYWSRLPFLLQRIFPTQGSNLGLPCCRPMLYHLSHQGSPMYLAKDFLNKLVSIYPIIPTLYTSMIIFPTYIWSRVASQCL